MALEALTRIGQLYHSEQNGKALSIDARQQLRMEQIQPVVHISYKESDGAHFNGIHYRIFYKSAI